MSDILLNAKVTSLKELRSLPNPTNSQGKDLTKGKIILACPYRYREDGIVKRSSPLLGLNGDRFWTAVSFIVRSLEQVPSVQSPKPTEKCPEQYAFVISQFPLDNGYYDLFYGNLEDPSDQHNDQFCTLDDAKVQYKKIMEKFPNVKTSYILGHYLECNTSLTTTTSNRYYPLHGI